MKPARRRNGWSGMRIRTIVDAIGAAVRTPSARTGSDSPRLDEQEFRRRFLSQFQDDAYASLQTELDRVAAAAWDAYAHQRKSPHTRKAGPGYARSIVTLRSRMRCATRRVPCAMRSRQSARGI